MKYESPKKQAAYRALAKEIGLCIRREAERQKLTLTAVAELADVSQGNLSRMQSDGSCCLQLYALYKIAAALNVSIRRILPPGGWA